VETICSPLYAPSPRHLRSLLSAEGVLLRLVVGGVVLVVSCVVVVVVVFLSCVVVCCSCCVFVCGFYVYKEPLVRSA